MTGEQDKNSSVDRVAVKVPPFMPNDPKLWFMLLENSFDAAGVTQDTTKFNHAVAALDPRYAAEIRDILLKPKAERSYDLLKDELTKRMGATQEQNTRRLLENESLGDRKPTQYLRHLRNLAGQGFPDDVLQTLWLSRLPPNIQGALAAHRQLPLDKRAEIADSVAEAYQLNVLRIAEATTSNQAAVNVTSRDPRIDALERSMDTLLQKLTSLEVAQVSQSGDKVHERSRKFTRSRSRSRNSRSRSRASSVCWYHWKFGEQANRCEEPCSFAVKLQGNDQGSR